MYFLNEFDDQRPIICIFSSETPIAAAEVAAPILKLCPLNRSFGKPAQFNDRFRFWVKNDLVTGFWSWNENNGPDVGRRSWKYSWSACTGHWLMAWLQHSTYIMGWFPLLCLYFWKRISIPSRASFSHLNVTSSTCNVQPFLEAVNSPTRKKAWNASKYIALSMDFRKTASTVYDRDLTNCFKIAGVIGKRVSLCDLILW